MIELSLRLMLYGLGGVFVALSLLFFSIKLITKIFPEK